MSSASECLTITDLSQESLLAFEPYITISGWDLFHGDHIMKKREITTGTGSGIPGMETPGTRVLMK